MEQSCLTLLQSLLSTRKPAACCGSEGCLSPIYKHSCLCSTAVSAEMQIQALQYLTHVTFSMLQITSRCFGKCFLPNAEIKNTILQAMIFPGKPQSRVTRNISGGFTQAGETEIASLCWLSVQAETGRCTRVART